MTIAMRTPRKEVLTVTKCLAHCGCGWGVSFNDAAEVIREVIDHNAITGHCCHFQGEMRSERRPGDE